MRKFFFAFLCLAFSYGPCWGAFEWHSKHLTMSDGLSNNTVRYIYQDSKGFMWLSTLGGLSRYDGTNFVTYRPVEGQPLSLADLRVAGLDEDANGLLWIYTSPEIYSCYDLKKATFVDYTGCGEYRQNYSGRLVNARGDTWLWHEGNGCRRVQYRDGAFSSQVFRTEKGNLSNNTVNFVHEGAEGVMWVGTDAGLNRIEDGVSSTVLSAGDFYAAFTYLQRDYFVTTDNKMYTYAASSPVCTPLVFSTTLFDGAPVSLTGQMALSDKWVLFTDRGGYVFHPATRTVTVDPQLDIKGGMSLEDNKGDFWVYNHSGYVRYVDARTGDIRTFQLIPPDMVSRIDYERYHVVHDERGLVWISTYGNGLFVYDTRTQQMEHYLSTIEGYSHLSSDFLLFVAQDRSGGIWVSCEYSGLSYLTILDEGMYRIFPEDKSLADRSNTVRMLSRMNHGDIWAGTRKGGLYVYDSLLRPKSPAQMYESNIYASLEDTAGRVWLGSRGSGLCIGDQWYVNDPQDAQSLASDQIFALHKDHKGRMWVGTFGGGLDLAVLKNGQYTFTHFLNGLYSQRQIRVIRQDSRDMMWVGTSNGVYVFHPDSLIANPDQYYLYNYSNGKLRSNEVKCMLLDSKNRMWVSTSSMGFSLCENQEDYQNLVFEHFDSGQGLVNDMVQSIIEDDQGDIWLSTEYGISCFHPQDKSFDNFFLSTYTLGNVYSENSALKNFNGELLFGSNYGLVVLDPLQIQKNQTVSPVSFTNLKINGLDIEPNVMDSPLTQALAYTSDITLKFFQNSFAIDFSNFEFSGLGTTRYTYKLDHYEDDWSVPSSLNVAAYKNIPPGSYRLLVRACNSAGVWSLQDAALNVMVRPPFFRTPFAISLYILLCLMLMVVAFFILRNFNQLRTKIEVEKQLTDYKLVFFTNISHEFRTPLTLIKGAIDRIQEVDNPPKEFAQPLKIMERNTDRLLRLINQLLEFRKMQNNALTLSLEKIDVITFLYDVFLAFREKAETKNIEYAFVPSLPSYPMFIDKSNVDKVVYNLLSNAFKYTASGGKIDLLVDVNEELGFLKVQVVDNGIGIAKDKQGELFKRFMQSNFSSNSVGIGLHLTHELVKLHKGTIVYETHKGGGSIFTVTLPIDASVYETKDFLVQNNVILREEQVESAKLAPPPELPAEPLNARHVLVVDDDDDLRLMLKEAMQVYFQVETAADGVEGLEKANTLQPDLIICDVLMPLMNGYELTSKIKSSFETSHIPVILVTALSTPENLLEGIETGADAYITKPFSMKLLIMRAFKLIEQRDKLRTKYASQPGLAPPSLSATEKDKQFIAKLNQVVEANLGNPEFSMDSFSALMGLGRTSFYKKVRGVTGYSPNEYIRLLRVKKAAELLMSTSLTVSEITYKVGFSDPFYFSKCFKTQFGVPPSQYH